MPLLLVQAFLNTRHFEGDSDLLSDPETARRWLVETQLLPHTAKVTAAELELARGMRESIRRLLGVRRGEAPGAPALRPLRQLADAHSACLTVDDQGELRLDNPRQARCSNSMSVLSLIW